MGGREPAVVKVFEGKLQAAACGRKMDDLLIPTCGMDRNANADEIFAVGNRLILVEFKSYDSSSNAESLKDSACQLCTMLAQNKSMRDLHDQCHFIAWGEKPRGRDLEAVVCIYRERVCNRKTLPECTAISDPAPTCNATKDEVFINKLIERTTGLECDQFKNYLKQILGRGGHGKTDEEFRVALYGVSAHRNVFGRTFESYEDFNDWFNNPPTTRPKKKKP